MARFEGDIYSASLGMTTRLTVLFPELSGDVTPAIEGEPKIMYLLHGLGGNSSEWTRFSKIEYYAKKYNFIIVMPEVQRSFYFDTVYGAKYFTYLADELPDMCGAWFNIPGQREKTFICGESMGGYGAVKIGLNRPERFEGIGTLSGALDFTRIVRSAMNGEDVLDRDEIRCLVGEEAPLDKNQDALWLVRQAASNLRRPMLIQICGTEDFLYEDNMRFRDTASAAGYGHVYMEWPGEHAWPFWDVAVQRVFQYFCNMDLAGPVY